MSERVEQAVQHAKVLTVSDGVVHGTRDDASGRALVAQLSEAGFDVVEHRVTADGSDAVAQVLTEMCADFAGVIVSTGGTGFAPRDQTPEGTRQVIEREAFLLFILREFFRCDVKQENITADVGEVTRDARAHDART